MSTTLYNQYIYKDNEWKLVGTSADQPTKTSDLINDSGYITSSDIPVTSVNTKTGDIVLTAADVNAQSQINVSGILKGDGAGAITAAVAGDDYQSPLPSQTGNTGKFLTTNGSALSWQTVDALPSQSGNTGKFLTTDGSSASWAEVDIPTKTSDLNNDSNFVSDANYVHTDNNFTGTLKTKLEGIETGAEVNQNAFSNIKVGTSTIAADSKTDTLTLTAGSNITLTPDTTNDAVTIAATVPTKVSELTNDSSYITAAGAPVQSVNSKTGAITLSSSDVGALPDSTTIPQGTVTSVRVQATSPVQSSTSTAQSATLNTTISLADGYGDTKNPYAAKNANVVLAGPSTGTTSVPSFRSLVADDIPSLTKSKISDFPESMPPDAHTHGDITNAGDITTTATIASGDRLVINDESASKITNSSITFGTSTTTFLSNKGTWATPTGAVTSVNSKSGAVTLEASDVGALPDTTSIPSTTSELTNDSGFITSSEAPVQSVNSKTGDVSLTYSDVSAASSTHTHGSITNAGAISSDTTVASGDKIVITDNSDSSKIKRSGIAFGSSTTTFLRNDGSWQAPDYPVTSVNSKTGAVSLTASDVGALPSTTSIPTATSDLTNDSGFITSSDIPVTSVNTKTGEVSLSASDVGALPDTTDVTKWNGVSLANQIGVNTGDTTYVVSLGTSTSLGAAASKYPVTRIPTAHNIPKYDANAYLISTTPAASDNSTKVATTAYVDSAVGGITVPVTSVNTQTGDVVLTASDVGALPDSTSIPTATSDLTNDSGFITANDVPQELFIAEYGTETFANIRAAHVAGKIVFTINDAKIFRLIYCTTTSVVFVRNTGSPSVEVVTVSTANEWASEYINAQSEITASGILKGDGSGNITAATAGTDYVASESDPTVPSWAKAATKPSYTYTEVGAAASDHNHAIQNLTNYSARVYDATTSRTANTFLAAPNGSAGAASFRTIAAADLPNATTSAKGAVIAGSGLTMSTATLNHASSITAATAGTSSATSGATLAVPYVTYNATGHITAAGTHTHTISGLGVSAGGTGAATFTSGYALIGNGTNAITTRAITNNTATSTAVTASTNLVTMNTLRYAINRTTSVAAADTSYTTYMARGEALNSADTNPTANGCISWTYS